jgi:hypothetical protein
MAVLAERDGEAPGSLPGGAAAGVTDSVQYQEWKPSSRETRESDNLYGP